MSKRLFAGLLMAFSILVFSNGNIAQAEESNALTVEKIHEIHKEYVLSEYGEDADFAITFYGESGIDSRSARSLFQPPECIHRSEIFEWNEYGAFTQTNNTHTYNVYRAYTYISCGCGGTVQVTDNPPQFHSFHYVDKGHVGDTHYYDYCCEICGYLKYYRTYDCHYKITGKHEGPYNS